MEVTWISLSSQRARWRSSVPTMPPTPASTDVLSPTFSPLALFVCLSFSYYSFSPSLLLLKRLYAPNARKLWTSLAPSTSLSPPSTTSPSPLLAIITKFSDLGHQLLHCCPFHCFYPPLPLLLPSSPPPPLLLSFRFPNSSVQPPSQNKWCPSAPRSSLLTRERHPSLWKSSK